VTASMPRTEAGGRAGRASLDTTVVLGTTLGTGAAAWALTVSRMHGMDMGVATPLGSLAFFMSVWVPMTVAMMLPGTVPALLAVRRAQRRAANAALLVAGYGAVWTLFGLAVYGVYRPHGTTVAGVVVVAAGLYELTPVKRRFREVCRGRVRSGWVLGLCCVGSSGGLMLAMVALGVMSLPWMAVTAGVILFQKLLPPRGVLDASLAVAVLALGIAVIVAPSSVPALVRPV